MARNRNLQTQKNPSIISVTWNPEYTLPPPWMFGFVVSLIVYSGLELLHNTLKWRMILAVMIAIFAIA